MVTVETINSVIESGYLVMLESRGGVLYYLVGHHRYLAWFRKAKRVPLGGTNVAEGCYYVTHYLLSLADLKTYHKPYHR